jgi:hypothetical protein
LGALLCFTTATSPRAFAQASGGLELTTMQIARTVSTHPQNQRLIDSIDIDENFERLEIPILIGSSVLPALTIVESVVHDEPVFEIDPRWAAVCDSENELQRLERLGFYPYLSGYSMDWFDEGSPAERPAHTNLVRVVVWPSGHALWMVEGGSFPGSLRNSKGMLVEYRFGNLDFAKLIKGIEGRVFTQEPVPGYYRKSVLYQHHVFYGAANFHNLVIVNEKYIFRFLSQVTEQRDDSFFAKHKFDHTADARTDGKQFVDICTAVRDALPTERYMTLRSEPLFVWKGDTDPREKNRSPTQLREREEVVVHDE